MQLMFVSRAADKLRAMQQHERAAGAAAADEAHCKAAMLHNAASPQLPAQIKGAQDQGTIQGTMGDAAGEGVADKVACRASWGEMRLPYSVRGIGVAEAEAALELMRHEQELLASEREHLLQAVAVREQALRYLREGGRGRRRRRGGGGGGGGGGGDIQYHRGTQTRVPASLRNLHPKCKDSCPFLSVEGFLIFLLSAKRPPPPIFVSRGCHCAAPASCSVRRFFFAQHLPTAA
jgi:hypothetical protein